LTRYNIALIIGDGIGSELAASAKTVLESINDNSSKIKFMIKEVDAGDDALIKFGKALPDFSVDIIKKSDVCLKGPVGETAADVIIVLRHMFDLYANIRPAKSYPNIKNLAGSVDLVTVRENTEDVYLGWEFNIDENTVIALRMTTERASRRIAEYAFKTARLRDRKKKVVVVHKANVLRKGDGLFANTCRSVADRYSDVKYSEMYVDACAMNLIRNLGDILSDEAAQVVGGLGIGPSANIGNNFALFEPVHGAAFDIAGKDIANPTSILLSTKMMLEWLADKYNDLDAFNIGQHIEEVIISLLKQNKKTKDIGGNLSTTDFTKLVASSIY
jgi:3-isopropylmalate dehydrogenase